ncbi:MAG: hypothetical protein Q8R08_03975 [bacterium]|nr:hypothetical protein [bacterium]
MRGFTLAEILVVTFLFVLLIMIGVGIFLYNNRFYENQSGEIASIQASREATDRINEFARLALAFAPNHVYNSISYTTGSTTVVFRLPAIEADDDIIAGVYDYVIIAASSTAPNLLELISSPHPSSSRLGRYLLLTDKLTSITFTYDDANLPLAKNVFYDLTITETGRHPAKERVRGSATLRN